MSAHVHSLKCVNRQGRVVCGLGTAVGFRGVEYYAEIDDVDRLRAELPADGVQILVEREQHFTDGTSATSFEVELPDGTVGRFYPTASAATREAQSRRGHYMPARAWMTLRRGRTE